MIEQGVDGPFVAIDELDDTGREACGVDDLKQQLCRHGHFLAWLEDKAVARRHGIGQEPERDHAGEVEGCDGGHHAQRLTEHVLVDSGGNVLVVHPLQEDGCATGHLDILDAAAHFTFTLCIRLATLVCDGACQGVKILLKQCLQAKERLDALADRRLLPALPGGVRILDGQRHVAAG